ncbi:MAG: hypothetical protein QHC77_17545 [Stenotrophomonas sp.]|uniref:hypothetical protein n=1 Tax=Stenotrophomonas sp. TaxID=69392 RepID=UPI0029B1C1B0|nr:hypothetical protein [Stenotrophomonas sp.]MDX3933738.1 hypothetical protein [Stenotrophomonas sp.]
MLLSIALFLHDPRSVASDVATYAGCALLASAFLTECYYWTVERLNYPLMKLAITVLGVVALAAAAGVSKITVNDATGQDPSYFTSAVALLVPLSFVPVAAALVIVLGTFGVIIGLIWGLAKLGTTSSKVRDLDLVITLTRIFSGFVIVTIAGALLSSSSFIYPSMRWVASHSALFFDMYEGAGCSADTRDRVGRVNDDIVVIGRMTISGPQFMRVSCPLGPQSTALAPYPPEVEKRIERGPIEDRP